MSAADDHREAGLESRFLEARRLYEAGKLDAAEKIIVGVVAEASAHAPSHSLRGGIWLARGDAERAALNFARSVRLAPEDPRYRSNLAQALFRAGRTEDAVACFQVAAELAPDDPSIRGNFAFSLRELNRAEEACDHLRHALMTSPHDPQILGSLGNCLTDLGRFPEAETAYRSAWNMNRNHAGAAYNLALFLLRAGMIPEGLALYENRWQVPGWKRRPFQAKNWDGDPGDIRDKKLLVWGEQGLGDELLFSGCLQALIDAGADLSLECEQRLVPLMRRSWPSLKVFPALDPPDPALQTSSFDFQIPIGSLPHALGLTEVAGFSKVPPRLIPDPDRVEKLRQQYRNGDDVLIVGLSWRSGASAVARRKSSALELWQPILDQPNLRFVDLQYGDTEAERMAVEQQTGIRLLHDPEIDSNNDLDGFAAQVAAMDRIVTISNATAHFAGAMGIPTDLLLSNGALWHWFSGSAESPHYPSLKIYRQDVPGDWRGPICRVAENFGKMGRTLPADGI